MGTSVWFCLVQLVTSNCQIAWGAPAADRVDPPKLPGFEKTPVEFDLYSGYLTVPGPFKLTGYDELRVHYELHLSQGNPKSDPVVAWHGAGPGSPLASGLWAEGGFFKVDSHGFSTNPFAWNRVANVLYIEAPAGFAGSYGSSTCWKGGKNMRCVWDDTSQAEAYTHSLSAFFRAFPELQENSLFLIGESYFGQYGPNIANFILNNEPFNTTLNLTGIALGNACWGGDETSFQCNGPHEARNKVEFFYGKGLISKKLHAQALANCSDPAQSSAACQAVMTKVYAEMGGPYNVYNIYDTLPDSGGQSALAKYLQRGDVREALHLEKPGMPGLQYHMIGPASVTLYPELVRKINVLVYNGDADASVPYVGAEEWTEDLAAKGVLVEAAPWSPWYVKERSVSPAGYATSYAVPGTDKVLWFRTVRGAGHPVPQTRPKESLALLEEFLALAGPRRLARLQEVENPMV